MRAPVAPVTITRVQAGHDEESKDLLVAEEPLEIRLGHGPLDGRAEFRLRVTMRTPGHDADLALGFLFAEGIIGMADEVVRVVPCEQVKEEERGNVLRAELRPELMIDPVEVASELLHHQQLRGVRQEQHRCGACALRATAEAVGRG